ncbi:MAG: UDP-N-acetylmuramate dehydrogenase, partial [Flavobacteriales bacterium]|nr:UDP-N-acetylmuramate dehydrogenase [Flavobacteriales bacterium]
MIAKNVSLKPFNTFGVDVTAKILANVGSVSLLQDILADSTLRNENRFVLGGGSNILFTRNVDALVLKNEIGGIETIKEDTDTFLIKAGAGVVWHELVMYCIQNDFSGVENLSLIPGNVGAAPMQNIGAYGVELKDVFESLEAVEMETGDIHTFNANECEFGYRESVFKHRLKDRFVITSVTLRLGKQTKLNTSYGAMEQELESMNIQNPTILDVSNAVINIRQNKLPDPNEFGNAGSFFKNPIVDNSKFEELKSKNPNIPGYPSGDKTKLAAGWLIEQCGWKGKVVGNTGSHAKQSLVLVNY